MFTLLSDNLVPWYAPQAEPFKLYGYEVWFLIGAIAVGVGIALVLTRTRPSEKPYSTGTRSFYSFLGLLLGTFVAFFFSAIISSTIEKQERYETSIDSLQQWFDDEYGITIDRDRTKEIRSISLEDLAFTVNLDDRDTLVSFQLVEPDENGQTGYLLSNAEGALIEQK